MKPPKVDAEGVDSEPSAGLAAEDPHERAAAAAALGLEGMPPPGEGAGGNRPDERLFELCDSDSSPLVRAAALAALIRLAPRASAVRSAWKGATADADPGVRRRAAEVAPVVAAGHTDTARVVVELLEDPEVAEVAAWALGELGATATEAGAVGHLSAVVLGDLSPTGSADEPSDDALLRESAVAALGALGDPEGLDAILAGCRDRPTVRRRAVLALAPFQGPDVDAALETALADGDWQVRQAAEDLSAG